MKVIIEIDSDLFHNVVKRTQQGDYMSDVWLAVGHGIPYIEVPINEAIDIIRSTCKSCNTCIECPMNDNCNNQPAHWEVIKHDDD